MKYYNMNNVNIEYIKKILTAEIIVVVFNDCF